MTIYSLDILLSLFGTSLLFHIQLSLLFPDGHTGFSRGRTGGLVFPSLEEFFTVYCDPHSQRLWHSKAEVDFFFFFLELSCFSDNPADVGNLISCFSAFSKISLNIWKFTVHILLKPGLENFEHCFIVCEMSVIVQYFEHSLALPFLGIGMKTDLFQPVATAEFSKFADILRAALS